MYFECVGEVSVSDSVSVLNRGIEPITRFCLGFFKLVLVLPVSILGIGMGFLLFLGFTEWLLMQTNLGPFIIATILTF